MALIGFVHAKLKAIEETGDSIGSCGEPCAWFIMHGALADFNFQSLVGPILLAVFCRETVVMAKYLSCRYYYV